MKKLMGLSVLGIVFAMAASATAGERFAFKTASLQRTSLLGKLAFLGQVPPAPVPEGEFGPVQPVPVPEGPVTLFHCVKYKDLDEVAPCAVPMIVDVPDPCACYDPCSCCAPACVKIQICVPPCGCPCIKSNRKGTRITYDYGDYAVDIRVKDGYIEVDYQD